MNSERQQINSNAGIHHTLSRQILGTDWYDTESSARRVIEAKAQGVVMDGSQLAGLLEQVRLDDDEAKPHGSGATYWNNAVIACQVAIRDALAAPAQQVSVPDGWKLVPVDPTPEMISAGSDAAHAGGCDLYQLTREVMNAYPAMLAAAPAAPAAVAGLVEALDYQVLFDAIAAATSVYANGAINISVQVFRDALAAHRAKGVV